MSNNQLSFRKIWFCFPTLWKIKRLYGRLAPDYRVQRQNQHLFALTSLFTSSPGRRLHEVSLWCSFPPMESCAPFADHSCTCACMEMSHYWQKQRSKNAISYFGEYPGTIPLTLLQMIEAWWWGDSGLRETDQALVLFPGFCQWHFYSSAAVPVILTIFTLTCRLGCILGIALIRKGLILPDNITPGP